MVTPSTLEHDHFEMVRKDQWRGATLLIEMKQRRPQPFFSFDATTLELRVRQGRRGKGVFRGYRLTDYTRDLMSTVSLLVLCISD